MSGYKYDTYSEIDDDASIYSNNRNKVVKVMAEMHDDDKLCFIRKIRTPDGKKKKLILFGSGDTGTTIRNAVTGERYVGHKVGSKNEDIYFKAGLCTGEFGSDRILLFYESADQYEKHLGGSLDPTFKDAMALRQRLAVSLNAEERKPRFATTVVH
jgi:hypothetical protein